MDLGTVKEWSDAAKDVGVPAVIAILLIWRVDGRLGDVVKELRQLRRDLSGRDVRDEKRISDDTPQ